MLTEIMPEGVIQNIEILQAFINMFLAPPCISLHILLPLRATVVRSVSPDMHIFSSISTVGLKHLILGETTFDSLTSNTDIIILATRKWPIDPYNMASNDAYTNLIS